MSEWLRVREYKETLELIMRLTQHRLAQITKVEIEKKGMKKIKRFRADVGHDLAVRLAIATEGFGLVGERDPVVLENVRALNKLYTLYELWIWEMLQAGYTREEAEEALRPVLLLIKHVEGELYARSFTLQSVVAPLSRALAKYALKLKKEAEIEAEMSGQGALPSGEET